MSGGHEDIRIGTIVGGGPNTAGIVRQFLRHGFESFEVAFWGKPAIGDLKKLAKELEDALAGSSAVVSSLGVYGNPLEKGPKDRDSLETWKMLIDNAGLFRTDLVCGFTGRLRGKAIPDSMKRFKEVFRALAKRGRDKGVRIAFENCDMGGNWSSGDWNIAHNPAAWEMMFDAVPYSNLGLEWEPCHQMVNLIEPIAQLREWVGKIFHVHGKDATVKWDVVRKLGIGGVRTFALPPYARFRGLELDGYHQRTEGGEIQGIDRHRGIPRPRLPRRAGNDRTGSRA